MRKSVTIAACVLMGCGGAEFSAAQLGSGGGDAAPQAPDAGAEVAPAEDAGQGAHEDVVGHVAAADGSEVVTGAEAAVDAPPVHCVTDLSGIGTADFHIAFTLTTTYTGQMMVALANQRVGCDQTSVWWQVVLSSGGGIIFNTCDGMGACATVEAGNSVNDGLPHRVVLARVAGAISYSRDGVIGSAVVPDAYSLGSFGAPLKIGTNGCGDTPLAGHGTLTDLCVTAP
jgi:hypothetical protein